MVLPELTCGIPASSAAAVVPLLPHLQKTNSKYIARYVFPKMLCQKKEKKKKKKKAEIPWSFKL